MAEIHPSSEFQQNLVGSFVIQVERSLRSREIDTQDPTKVREALDNSDFWFGERGFWTQRSSTNLPPEKAQGLLCTTVYGALQRLGSKSEDVQSLRRMLNITEESPTLDDLKKATGGTPEGGDRTTEPVNIFKASPSPTEEKPPRLRDIDQEIADKVRREAWDQPHRVDEWFENQRGRTRALESRRARREARHTPEQQEVKPPTKWLLDEINSSLKEKGVDLNDRMQVDAQIRSKEFWMGTPESFWGKRAPEGQIPEDYQEQKCREVLADIKQKGGQDAHNNRAELRVLFHLSSGYRFDLEDLIDLTSGYVTHSQLLESEAAAELPKEAATPHEAQALQEAAPIQELIEQANKDDGTPRRWQQLRGTLAPLGGAAIAQSEDAPITPIEEPEETVAEEINHEGEILTNSLAEAFRVAQEKKRRGKKAQNGQGV